MGPSLGMKTKMRVHPPLGRQAARTDGRMKSNSRSNINASYHILTFSPSRCQESKRRTKINKYTTVEATVVFKLPHFCLSRATNFCRECIF